MGKDEIIAINSGDVKHEFLKEEMFHILRELGGFLELDHGTLESDNPGCHFELKSGVHSDSFMDFSKVLQHENLRKIIARQLVNKYQNTNRVTANLNWNSPNCVAGIPNGATLLGKDVAEILLARKMELIKQSDGSIVMNSVLKLNDVLLFVEDVCTKGTALNESVNALYNGNPSGMVVPFVLTIVNRGGLNQIQTDKGFVYNVISLFSVKFNEWNKDDCYPCSRDSKCIKPKEMRELNLVT